MNRPGVGPQSLRGIPSGFANQQQLQQNRSVSSRLPQSGKMAGNGASWAFGGGVPMGSAGLGNPRPNNGPMTSFAQSLGSSSQPSTPLDLSEFPSLSNNQTQPSQSTWAAQSARNVGPTTAMRAQPSHPISAQQQSQQQQDDLFASSSQLPSSQTVFRFNQNAVSQSASHAQSADDFPPLSRNSNGDIGQARGSGAIQSVGFGAQANGMGFGSTNPPQQTRNNGLLDVLSGSNRTGANNRVSSPVTGTASTRSPVESGRQGVGGTDNDGNLFANQFPSSNTLRLRDEPTTQPTMTSAASSLPDGVSQQPDGTIPRSQTADSGIGSSQGNGDDTGPEVQDPLAHMSESDKFGLKGFLYMMNNFPDYAALVTGQDVSNLGFDLSSNEPFATQQYSLWDNEPARPVAPRYNLPECYRVQNIAPLENKVSNLNDEALIFMFYSNPKDIQQVMAAQELHNRNWRYHKKLRLWLTKDDMMVPQQLGSDRERGYYIFFDIKQWHRERREFTLVYEDLETLPNNPRPMA